MQGQGGAVDIEKYLSLGVVADVIGFSVLEMMTMRKILHALPLNMSRCEVKRVVVGLFGASGLDMTIWLKVEPKHYTTNIRGRC